MEIHSNYNSITPPTAAALLAKDPTKLVKILRLIGNWTGTFFSLSTDSRSALKKIDTHLKDTNAIIKLVFFLPTFISLMSNLTNAKEHILNWLNVSNASTATISQIAQDVIANHIAPFFESTSDFIATLESLHIVNITEQLPIIQTIGGAALFIMSAYQVQNLVKRYFSGDTGGTYYLEVAKQASSIAISILSVAAAFSTLPFLAPTILSLSTISLFTGLYISADKIEKEAANHIAVPL